jgi:hypothetical protein
MAKSRKYRKNIMKKKVSRSTRSGGDPLSSMASSGLSGMTSAASSGLSGLSAAGSDGINGIIDKLKSFAECNFTTKVLFEAFKMPGVIPQAVNMINIPDSFDTPLQSILNNQTKVKDLLIDILTVFKCSDSEILAEALETVFVIDKIGELLETPNLTGIDEAAKESLPLFKEMKNIIISEKFQDLLGRVLNEMETKKHINSEQKKAFILFFVGEGKEGKDTANKILQGNSILGAVSSLFGSKSGDNANTEPDTRCGESQIVQKSWFSGDYCAPKSNEAPTPPAEKEREGQAQAAEGADKKEGEAPAVEGEPTEGADKTNLPAAEAADKTIPPPAEAADKTNPPPAEAADKTNPPPAEAADKTNPPPAEAADKTNPPPAEAAAEETGEATFTQLPQKKSSWWGGKYKRVKHTKKSKKSKSKKSKRSKK